MIEDVIRRAMDNGEFDNLPGKGKPLDLSNDSVLDPMNAIVHRILKKNGVSHPLLEARKAFRSEADRSRDELKGAWRRFCSGGSPDDWTIAVRKFQEQVHSINRQIRIFNLKAPSPALHGLLIDAGEEIKALQEQA
jgi:DnaJ homolog subfamily C member 28